MRRWGLAIVVVAASFLMDPSFVSACSCVAFTKAQLVENADVIFTGTVTERTGGTSFGFGPGGCYQTTGIDPIRVTFTVETVYKGDAPTRVTLNTASNSAACGYEFVADKRYTVFATGSGDTLATNLCRGNESGAIVPAVYGLGAGRPPR